MPVELDNQMAKAASTALVRRIVKGLLSPSTVQRAAQAMPEGSFRFVKNLGRGQFSLADKVVGNVGGHAGEMVRKLGTHADMFPQQEYGPLKQLIDGYNTAHKAQAGGNPIAPYVAVNSRGAFQQLANEAVTPPKALTDKLSDLHPANIGPNGQIIDFGSNGSDSQFGMSRAMNYFRPRIDPATQVNAGRYFGRDMLGNLGEHAPEIQAAGQATSNEVNNNIRKFWAQPTDTAKKTVYDQIAQTADARGQQLIDKLPGGKIPIGNSPTPNPNRGMTETVVPQHTPPQPGWWDRLKADFSMNKPTYFGVPATGAAVGAAGYGAYKMLQSPSSNPVAGAKPLALPK